MLLDKWYRNGYHLIKPTGVDFRILPLLVMLILLVIRAELILGSSYVPDSCKVLHGVTFAPRNKTVWQENSRGSGSWKGCGGQTF